MASTSSPTTPSLKHDVFLSFRGKDTRYGFTSHLYRALKRNQIDAFIDDKLDGGEKLEPALLKRIEDSYISVVIFSKNYARSTFCLRELSKIHECMETKGQMVLPVFHQLDPSQVQDLTGSYGEALSRHERDCASEEVDNWRHALKEIANLKGWDSSVIKDETKLIEEIASDIQRKLHHVLSTSIDAEGLEGLVGMQSPVEHIESLLSFGSTGVLIVGIWGIVGIGKSKTAETVYNRNSHKFEGGCFFRNVSKKSMKHGVGHVRQEILGEVLGKEDLSIRRTVLPPDIKLMLQRKKVLIVLDDVNDAQHLKFLVGEDGLFGQGSRIIVTSRDKQVLINACQENRIYEVTELDEGDALRLFSIHAFKQNNPPDRYTRLSKDVVSCVKGIPLVLEVLGVSLYKKTSVEYWESKVAQLRTNGGEEICYDKLDRTEKKIFLGTPDDQDELKKLKGSKSRDMVDVLKSGWTLLMTSLIIEIASVVSDQLGYALVGMVLAFVALLVATADLIHMAGKERRSLLPIFHRPSTATLVPRKPAGTIVEYFGFVGAVWQCVYSTVGYAYSRQKKDNPIKMSLLPLIFFLCVLISKIYGMSHDDKSS